MNNKEGVTSKKDFLEWINSVKSQIRSSQLQAALKVNGELLRLYWYLGAEISSKQTQSHWGDGFLHTMSEELAHDFPNIKGFSYRNLKNMRQWYQFYNQSFINGKQPVSQLEEVFFSVPWGHHIYIMQKCKDVNKALFYLNKTVENGWSRSVLLNFLDTNLYESQGYSVNNFCRLLDNPYSDLAKQTLKDPYNFDFITLTEGYRERELEDALTANITRFLLELGQGFAYVGKQVPLEIDGDTIYLDLLFYHLELRSFVVVELKTSKFKGEHLGQLGLYVSAVNHLKRKPTDNPTIGLLICKTKNNVMAQYALESTNQPIGISEYSLSKLLPGQLQSQLPTIDDIESVLKEEL